MASLVFPTLFLLLLSMTAPARSQTMDQLFTIDPSCNGYNMDKYLDDARTMLKSAQTAISTVQSAKTFVGVSPARNYMRNARNCFGTTYYKPTTLSGINSADQGTLGTASGNLQKVQSLLAGQAIASTGSTLTPANAYISCSDSPYEPTTNAQDIDPSLAAGTTVQEAFAIPSVYYIPGNEFTNAQGIKRRVVRAGPTKPDPICSVADKVVALTEPQTDFTPDQPLIQIILCPSFFASPYLQTIDVSPASPYVISSYQFAASAFIHELFHVISNTFSDERFTTKGGTTFYDPYGAAVIYALANNPSDFRGQIAGSVGTGPDVLELPDAYRTFCDMCQFKDIKWDVVPWTPPSKVKRTLRPKTLDRWKL